MKETNEGKFLIETETANQNARLTAYDQSKFVMSQPCFHTPI